MVVRLMSRLIACLALLAALPAFAAGLPVDVRDAWARATVGGQSVGAAYLTLQARSSATLVGIASSAAKQVELHEMVHNGDMMGMRPVERLTLKPGQTLRLSPNGSHLMLTDLTGPLKPGSVITLTLRWQVGTSLIEQPVAVEVKPLGYQP